MNNVKIKNKVVYSIIFMRDDGEALSFRMGAFWLKFLIYFFIFIFALASGGIALTYHYWWKSELLEANLLQQQAQLKPLQEQLGRLDRLNSFAQAVDGQTPGELRPLLKELGSSNATSAANKVDQAKVAQGVVLTPEGTQPVAQPENANIQPPATTSGTKETPKETPAQEVVPQIENKYLRVNDLSIRFIGRSRLQVNFDLSNIDTQRATSGVVRISAVNAAGEYFPLRPDRNNGGFRINRSKEFVLDYTLLEKLSGQNIKGLRLDVEDSSGVLIHRENLPLPSTAQ